MKRLFICLLVLVSFVCFGFCEGGSVVPFAAHATYADTANGVTGAATTCPAAGIIAGSLPANVIVSSIATGTPLPAGDFKSGTSTADITVDSMTVTKRITAANATIPILNGAIAAGGVITMAAAPISSTGKYGMTDTPGHTIYSVIVATTLPTGGVCTLSLADGKAGGFDIIMGTFSALGSFTTGAVVTLTSNSSVGTSITSSNDQTLNIYDGGTVVGVINKSSLTLTAYIRYWYVN